MRVVGPTIAAVAALGLSLFTPTAARADLMWALSDVTFADGGTAVGWFDTDSSGLLTAWDIMTQGGTSGISPFNYNISDSSIIGGSTNTIAVGTNPGQYIVISFNNILQLQNSPDDINTSHLASGEVLKAPNGTLIAERFFSSGDAIAAPEPATLTLLGAGLLALAASRRRRRVT